MKLEHAITSAKALMADTGPVGLPVGMVISKRDALELCADLKATGEPLWPVCLVPTLALYMKPDNIFDYGRVVIEGAVISWRPGDPALMILEQEPKT